MGEIEDLSMNVANAYQDNYFDKQKRPVFDAILNRYLTAVDTGRDEDVYEVIATLGRRHPAEFQQFIEELRQKGLLS
ncbi:MAG TPA: hypothetical protein VLH56_17810 [Dissulfurispiraceae bacterium]|nr:hypothetical protein [Dissulfurispiraceae bacterium]